MLQGWVILLVSVLYLSVLFAIAYYGDKRAKQKRSLIAKHYERKHGQNAYYGQN